MCVQKNGRYNTGAHAFTATDVFRRVVVQSKYTKEKNKIILQSLTYVENSFLSKIKSVINRLKLTGYC